MKLLFSFVNCKVKIIILPKQVHVIDWFAFFESLIEHVSIECSDDGFVFDPKLFLIDSDTSTVIRCPGKGNDLLTSRDNKILAQSCFSGCFNKRNEFGVVRCEDESNLMMIGQSDFANCILYIANDLYPSIIWHCWQIMFHELWHWNDVIWSWINFDTIWWIMFCELFNRINLNSLFNQYTWLIMFLQFYDEEDDIWKSIIVGSNQAVLFGELQIGKDWNSKIIPELFNG
jgi:hypothetical protein